MRKKDDNKMQNIKKAVIQMVQQEGLHGASVSKIAKAAGVSPATVYIYYVNKDAMLRDIYLEYAEQAINDTLDKIRDDMDGEEIIEKLIDNYYTHIMNNQEEFRYTEQYSSCSILLSGCAALGGMNRMYRLFTEMKERHIFDELSNEVIYSVLLSPTKDIALRKGTLVQSEAYIEELVKVAQNSLLIR